jgi:hypothetical protein
MRTIWIVRWRGMEESYPNRQDAMDRRDQLDAWGIAAELLDAATGPPAVAPWITSQWRSAIQLAPTAAAQAA